MKTQAKPACCVIQGLTRQGRVFRPRDWAERLCGCMATFGPYRQPQYSPYVYVQLVSGVKSLVVEAELWEVNPKGYEFLMDFARENGLQILEQQPLLATG